MLILLAVGIVILYVCLLGLILSLFNIILFFIIVGVMFRYCQWGVKNIKKYIQNINLKKIRKWLEK
jgi:uncharacterized membrane protein YbaN (DUF454 family)